MILGLGTLVFLIASGQGLTTWSSGFTPWDVVWLASGETLGREVHLPDRFLVPGSETLVASGRRLVRGKDYSIDYHSGTVVMLRFLRSTAILFRYRRVPLKPRGVYRLRAPPAPGATAITDSSSPPQHRLPLGRSDLLLQGTKTVSLSMGTNRDLSLDQSLRLTMRGNLPEGVEVEAVLSDENLPIQPEGTTQELEELDQVKVQVRKGGLQATLGDYRLEYEGARFASFARKLEGMKLTAAGAKGGASVAMASSRGEFASIEFMGQDSKQGPYALADYLGTSDLAAGDIVVLAGTERLWVNGEQKSRGADRDYVIDYGRGEITFTENYLVTDEARIVVDFEYSNRKYRRTAYYAQASVGGADRAVGIWLALAREGEDKESPLEASLGEEEREALREAGDDPLAARVAGWSYVGLGAGDYDTFLASYFAYVGESEGEYDLVMESAGSGQGDYRAAGSRFEYWGPGGGDYRVKRALTGLAGGSYHLQQDTVFVYRGEGAGIAQVSFSAVPQGQGSYRLSGEGQFLYVGPGHGDRSPYRYLPLPLSRQVADVRFRARPGAGLQISGEGAWSQTDLNLHSGRDDSDNGGGALFVAAVHTLPATPIGSLTWQGSYRHQQSGFLPLGRVQAADYYRQWNVASQDRGREQELDLEVEYRPAQALALALSTGNLVRPAGLRVRRTTAAVRWGRAGHTSFSYSWNRARTTSDIGRSLRWHHLGSLSVQTGVLNPRVRLESEKTTGAGDIGRAFLESEANLGVAFAGQSDISVWWQGRWQRLAPVGRRWMEEFVANSIGQDLHLRRGRWGAAQLQIVRRRKEYSDAYGQYQQELGLPVSSPTTTHLGRADVSLVDPGGLASISINYRAKDEEIKRLIEELVPEGEAGGGEYDSTGGWVGPELGTHRKELVPVGDPETVAEVAAGARARLQPRKLVGESTLVPPVGWEGELRAQLSTASTDRWGVYMILPRVFLDDQHTVRSTLRWRQALNFPSQPRSFSGVLQLERRLERDNRYANRRDRSRSTDFSFALRYSPRPGISLRGETSVSRQTELKQSRAFVVRERRAKIEAVRPSRPGLGGAVSLGWELSTAEEETPGHEVRAWGWGWSVSPSISAGSLAGWAGELRWQIWSRTYHGPWESLRVALQRSERDGLSHSIRARADYKLSQHTSINLSYQTTRNPRSSFIHEGRMEVRAFF